MNLSLVSAYLYDKTDQITTWFLVFKISNNCSWKFIIKRKRLYKTRTIGGLVMFHIKLNMTWCVIFLNPNSGCCFSKRVNISVSFTAITLAFIYSVSKPILLLGMGSWISCFAYIVCLHKVVLIDGAKLGKNSGNEMIYWNVKWVDLE